MEKHASFSVLELQRSAKFVKAIRGDAQVLLQHTSLLRDAHDIEAGSLLGLQRIARRKLSVSTSSQSQPVRWDQEPSEDSSDASLLGLQKRAVVLKRAVSTDDEDEDALPSLKLPSKSRQRCTKR